MSEATILSAGAIEAYANGVIDALDDSAMVEIPKKVAGKMVAVMQSKNELDWFRIEDKLHLVIPGALRP